MRQKVLLSLCIACSFLACEESREACLDTLAINFDVGAVESCDSCCQYPDLTIDIALKYDTLDYRIGEFITTETGDSLSVADIELILSGFRLVARDTAFNIINTVERAQAVIKDDYLLVHPKTLDGETLGQTAFESELDSLGFLVGVNRSSIDVLKPFSILESGRVAEVIDSTYDSDRDVFTAFYIKYALQDSVHRDISIEGFASEVVLSMDRYVPPGKSWQIEMDLDLNKVFKNITDGLTQEQAESIFRNNITESFSMRGN